ncbi:MAG: hypothetical protein K2K77_09230 [Duncaniella sp.]|nr:hypothetical protein [Duncaniella sp.]
MVELANGVKYKISNDGREILSYDNSTKFWTHHAMAPQGKTFKDIRLSKMGTYCEIQCEDGRWYDTMGMGNVGVSLTHEEQLKNNAARRSESKPKKSGSLGWRIVKGTFKGIMWFLAFCVGLQAGGKED